MTVLGWKINLLRGISASLKKKTSMPIRTFNLDTCLHQADDPL